MLSCAAHCAGSRAFKGFAADPARLAQLHVLVACLTCMQQAVQASAFKQLMGDSSAAEVGLCPKALWGSALIARK